MMNRPLPPNSVYAIGFSLSLASKDAFLDLATYCSVAEILTELEELDCEETTSIVDEISEDVDWAFVTMMMRLRKIWL